MKTKDKFLFDRTYKYKVIVYSPNRPISTYVLANNFMITGDQHLMFFQGPSTAREVVATFSNWSHFIRIEPVRYTELNPFVCCPYED